MDTEGDYCTSVLVILLVNFIVNLNINTYLHIICFYCWISEKLFSMLSSRERTRQSLTIKMVLSVHNKGEEYFPCLLKQAFCAHKWLLMSYTYSSVHAHKNALISLLPVGKLSIFLSYGRYSLQILQLYDHS